MRPLALVFVLAFSVIASAAHAQDWGKVATVSATMGVSGSRLCLGEASRGDIGCPAYAPSVTTAGDLGVSGTVTANKFIGDGSGLLNLSASGDRIVSGTLSMLAISNTGYISLTTGATNWGYLSSGVNYLPNLKTTTLSATTAIQVGSNSLTCGTTISGTMRYSAISSTMEYCNGSAWTSMGPSATSPVSFMVKRSANQTVASYVETKIQFDQEVFDTNNNFNTSTNRFTPTVPGKYLITLSTYCADATTQCNALIYKNSSSAYASFAYTGTTAPQATAIIDMNGTTDYLEGYVYNGGGTTLAGGATGNHYTYFDGVLLAPQGGGSGGTATPAGSTDDVQYASGGALAADTGKFTYAGGLLSAPNISTTNISLSTINGVLFTGGASGDRIVSGTLSMLAISSTGYISLTTGATNWGYLSSLASFIPVLGANTISSTNISVTLSHYTPRAITSFAGAGGNYIVSSTSSVSASSAGSVKIAAGGKLAMTIVSSGNVGIGTTAPSTPLTLGNAKALGFNSTTGYNSGSLGAAIYKWTDNSLFIDNFDGSVVFRRASFLPSMVIDPSGNVGIGTTAPAKTLDVNGGASIGTTAGSRVQLGTNGSVNFIQSITTGNAAFPLSFYQGPGEAMRIDTNGNVGIGTTAPSYMLHVNGSVAGVGAYNALSDRRFKKNIHPADYGLAAIEKLRPVTFDWISPTSPQLHNRQLGLIAQEVQPLVPEAVSVANDPSHTMSIAYSTLVPVLIKAVQELKADNDNLRAELRTVRDTDHAAIESLQRQLNELRAAKR
ncbi:Complement C1q protein [Nitrobacter hamburgensis X14]|uniref:Complement C1q protein n=1 Tax=Nitrobacter hamburgensis (strain DSM 10229 / NCIMB 13809 / X14) TaxID=323097 RepID=Q1QGU4_NITHX|nr:tail fiber domain-containing protein [Nitrobacter hamburgensis]ABE64553.1 Complement C1q protein [Nitrobacter hamburgensis X14]